MTITVQVPTPLSPATNFEEIYREFAPLVYRTAWGVMGSREDAEDVLQSIFLKLLRREFPPDLQKNPKAYLYRAAVNLSLDVLKARRRYPIRLLNDSDRLDVPGPTSTVFDEEVHQRLYEAIASLSPEAAEVLILRYMQNKSITEIAAAIGVSHTAIAVRLFRSRARLRKLLRVRKEEKS